MRYALAIAACVAEGLLYVIVGVLLGWKNGGGGIIPMMVLFAVWGATWVAITGNKGGNRTES